MSWISHKIDRHLDVHDYIISTACVRIAPNRVQYAITVEHYQHSSRQTHLPISQNSVVLLIVACYRKEEPR
jgi:hypothetical protein